MHSKLQMSFYKTVKPYTASNTKFAAVLSSKHASNKHSLHANHVLLHHSYARPAMAFCTTVMALAMGDTPALSAMFAAVLSLRNGSRVCSTCATKGV